MRFVVVGAGAVGGVVGGRLAQHGHAVVLVARALAIAGHAATPFSRLLAGAIGMILFTYAFVNMAMVSGILPVVGVPLPLISYGGTSMVTLMAGFGILMSIHSHRKLVAS